MPPTARRRTILIVEHYPALLRARRRRARRDQRWRHFYARHRAIVEGVHGEIKSQHGLRRAARRRRWNVAIQCYLTAAVINLKRLANTLSPCALLEWLMRCVLGSQRQWACSFA